MPKTRGDDSPPQPEVQPPDRLEWGIVILLMLVGVALRCQSLSSIEVEHFDEGVYASNIWFSEVADFRYPNRHLYAPPLLPGLIEVCLLSFGIAGFVAMLPNLIAGSATVLLLWRVGRSWFGTRAGMTAAALCACSDFHILYSRTALTDPVLAVAMLGAVFCIWRTHLTGDARWALAAALVTGLAWWTKYSGWLPLVVGLSGVTAWQIFTPGRQRAMLRNSLICLGIAATAVAIWSPVWLGLEPFGGYESVAENHRGYLVGITGWWDGFARHVALQRHFTHIATCAGVAIAVVLVTVMDGEGFTWNRLKLSVLGLAVLATGLCALLGAGVFLGVLAAVGIIWNLQPCLGNRHLETPLDASPSARQLAGWLLAAWFVGLLLTTPMYRPYPRLALPWLISAWLGCGLFVERVYEWWTATGDETKRPTPSLITRTAAMIRQQPVSLGIGLAIVGIACLALATNDLLTTRATGLEDRSDMRRIAAEITDRIETQQRDGNRSSGLPDFAVYVYGEPGLFYQLKAAQARDFDANSVIAPIGTVNFPPVTSGKQPIPTFLIIGPQALRTGGFEAEWEKHGDRFEAVGKPWTYNASDLVLLDNFSPAEIEDTSRSPILEFQLYRLRSR